MNGLNTMLLGEIAARPWALHQPFLRGMRGRAEGYTSDMPLDALLDPHDPEEGDGYTRVGDIAILEVVGTVLKRVPAIYQLSDCAAVSTEVLRAGLARALADDRVRSILLYVDSPGGEVSGVQELSDAVYEARGRKPVHAMISDLACSAAYWIASQATTISANATARVGCIGVYALIYETARYWENEGVSAIVISSGGVKGAGIEGTRITDPQIEEWQTEIDGLTDLFVSAVARGRGKSPDKMRALATGQVWLGAEAMALGLIDRVENGDQTLGDLVAETPTPMSAENEETIMAWFLRRKQATKGVEMADEDVKDEQVDAVEDEVEPDGAEPKSPDEPEIDEDDELKAGEAEPEAEASDGDPSADGMDDARETLAGMIEEYGEDIGVQAFIEKLSGPQAHALRVAALEADLEAARAESADLQAFIDQNKIGGEATPLSTGGEHDEASPSGAREAAVGKHIAQAAAHIHLPK